MGLSVLSMTFPFGLQLLLVVILTCFNYKEKKKKTSHTKNTTFYWHQSKGFVVQRSL